MAASAGLALSFSTERSVEDELQRESSADAGTVVLSYAVGWGGWRGGVVRLGGLGWEGHGVRLRLLIA